MPKVAIIILNWNGLADTLECLESLKKLTYPDYEIIVVDNGSAGNDADTLVAKYGDYVHLIRNDKNYGFTEGNNIGIRHAMARSKPDYILLLNNDTTVDSSLLVNLVAAAERDPSIGIAGPKVYFPGERRLQSAGARISLWTGQSVLIGYRQMDTGQHDDVQDVDWVVGCGLLIRASLIRTIGLLHSPYFALFEETEWCLKCRRAGHRVVYVSQAVMWHKGAQTTNRMSGFRSYYLGRNQILFMRRNAGPLQLAVFLALFPFAHLARNSLMLLLRQRDSHALVRYYAGVIDGIRLPTGRAHDSDLTQVR